MDQSFADRLARINGTNGAMAVNPNADLIGATASTPLPDLPRTAEPLSYDQRFKMRILNHIFSGIAWMAPTGYIAVNYWAAADFLAGSDATEQSLMNVQAGLAVALTTSIGLYYWVAREAVRDMGKLHGMPLSLAIGGAIGAAIGAGPVTLFALAQEYGVFGL